MEIIFLGTSSSWAIPYINCRCPQCTSKDIKDKRSRSAIFIKPDILFDSPPDLPLFFQKYKLLKIKNLYITHSHSDHIFGLKDLFPDYKPAINDLKIYTKKDVQKEILKIFPNLKKNYFSSKNQNNISFFPVFHSEMIKTYGLLYEDKLKIAYIPDTKGIPENSLKKLRNLNLLILDGTGGGKNHLKEDEIFSLISKIKPEKTILTHIGHWKIKHKELEKKFKNIASISFDGMEIKI